MKKRTPTRVKKPKAKRVRKAKTDEHDPFNPVDPFGDEDSTLDLAAGPTEDEPSDR